MTIRMTGRTLRTFFGLFALAFSQERPRDNIASRLSEVGTRELTLNDGFLR